MASALEAIFASEAFYWGALSGSEADRALANKPKGSFLVRWSGNSNAPVISFVSDDAGGITHALVQPAPSADGHITLQGSTKSFASVAALLASHTKSLIHPLLSHSYANASAPAAAAASPLPPTSTTRSPSSPAAATPPRATA